MKSTKFDAKFDTKSKKQTIKVNFESGKNKLFLLR